MNVTFELKETSAESVWKPIDVVLKHLDERDKALNRCPSPILQDKSYC